MFSIKRLLAWFHDFTKEVGDPTFQEVEENVRELKEALATLQQKGYTIKVSGRGAISVVKLEETREGMSYGQYKNRPCR